MRVRKSTQIAVGFGVFVALAYGGYMVITDRMIMGERFSPIAPGEVNLVGVDTGAGYQVIVANQIAQLVQVQGGFGGEASESGGVTEGAIKKRVPIREMLNALRGDEKALADFVMIMNDIREDDSWPTVEVVWKAEDIRRALDGDAALAKKLVRDLNVNLDGTPLPSLRFEALENGILVDFPVPVQVNILGSSKLLIARVRLPYKPRLLRAVEAQYADNASIDRSARAGFYRAEAQLAMEKPENREDVRRSLLDRISESNTRKLADAPERLLSNARVVVNADMITGAGYDAYDTTKGTQYKMTVSLNDEGRRRLWQYSKKRVGDQLLLTVRGIAIAAPRIQHELAQGSLTINQMEHQGLVKDAVERINRHQAGAGK